MCRNHRCGCHTMRYPGPAVASLSWNTCQSHCPPLGSGQLDFHQTGARWHMLSKCQSAGGGNQEPERLTSVCKGRNDKCHRWNLDSGEIWPHEERNPIRSFSVIYEDGVAARSEMIGYGKFK